MATNNSNNDAHEAVLAAFDSQNIEPVGPVTFKYMGGTYRFTPSEDDFLHWSDGVTAKIVKEVPFPAVDFPNRP